MAFADSSVFEIFTFPFAYGISETALDDLHSVVISENIAQKFFDSRNPVGQTLNFNNKIDLKVTGVMKNIPHNSLYALVYKSTRQQKPVKIVLVVTPPTK